LSGRQVESVLQNFWSTVLRIAESDEDGLPREGTVSCGSGNDLTAEVLLKGMLISTHFDFTG